MATFIPFAIFLFFVILLLIKSIKIVPASKAMVVFRLGQLKSVYGPGFHVLMPFIEMGKFIDLGRQTIELNSQKISVLDSSPVNTTSIIGYQITDPAKAMFNVGDFKSALGSLMENHLRKSCSEITLTELLTERPKIQERVRESMNRDANEWGIQVDDFTINFVDVPEEVQNELRRKAEQERLRRMMSES
jgi:regulator of protease activity HflC (stomatin/prohibitin superfamily)